MILSSLPFAQLQLFEDAVMQCLLTILMCQNGGKTKKVVPMQETAQSPYPCLWGTVSSDA